MKLNYLIWSLLLGLFTASSFAESELPQELDKARTCNACHGLESANPEWPKLAGQHASYLIKQLRDYKNNQTRQDPTMYAFVNSLNDQDIEDIARYYASLKPKACVSKSEKLSHGEKIYKTGDLKKHITACIACHGPNGAGNAQAVFPALAGQNPNYTVNQLNAFKTKKRHNDINGIMHDISKRMNENDMQDVAEYICNLK